MKLSLLVTAVASPSHTTDAWLVPVMITAVPPASAAAPTSRAIFFRPLRVFLRDT